MMSVSIPNKHKSGFGQGPTSCSVCLEVVNDAGDRSIAKLACGHRFHLDCIGSAFNAKGTMQCPNCRRVEDGQWLYANGCHQQHEFMMEDMIIEDEYDLYAGVSELLFPNDLMHFGHQQWCPYESSSAQFSVSLGVSLGDTDLPPASYADLIVDVLIGEYTGGVDLNRQGEDPSLSRHVEDTMAMTDMPLSPHHGATAMHNRVGGQHVSHPPGHWAQPAPTPLIPLNSGGPLGGTVLHDRPRWPRSDANSPQTTENSFHRHFENNRFFERPVDLVTNTTSSPNILPRAQNNNLHAWGGSNHIASSHSPFGVSDSHRGRVSVTGQVPAGQPVHYSPDGLMSPELLPWGFSGVSTVHDAGREMGHSEHTDFTQWRWEGSSSFWLCPPEPEVQRWAPPPLPGLYGLRNTYGSDISTQAGFRDPEGHFSNQFQGHRF